MRGSVSVTNPDASHGEPPKEFSFDTVFGQTCKQVDVYNEVARPIVEFVLEGYNGRYRYISDLLWMVTKASTL